MAAELGLELLSTDPASLGGGGMCPLDDWSQSSQYIADNWIGNPDTLIEGVAVPRALRKWKAQNPGEAFPGDLFIVLAQPRGELRPGQQAMFAGLMRVIDELRQWIPTEAIEFR